MTPKSFAGNTFLQMTLFFFELYVAVPLAIAFYPQMSTIKSSAVEEEIIKEYESKHGKAPEYFYYNKGL